VLETWIRFFLLLAESAAAAVMFKLVTPSVIPSIAHCFPSLFSFFLLERERPYFPISSTLYLSS